MFQSLRIIVDRERLNMASGTFHSSGFYTSSLTTPSVFPPGFFSASWLFIMRVSQGSGHEQFSSQSTCNPLVVSSHFPNASRTELLIFFVQHALSNVQALPCISTWLYHPSICSGQNSWSHSSLFCLPPLSQLFSKYDSSSF